MANLSESVELLESTQEQLGMMDSWSNELEQLYDNITEFLVEYEEDR